METYCLTFGVLCLIWFIKWCLKYIKFLKDAKSSSVPMITDSFHVAFMKPEDIFNFARNKASLYKRSYRHYFFGRMNYCIIKAKDAEIILLSTKHINKSLIYKFLHPFLGEGLLTSKGEKWHSRRRLLTPTFHFNILKQFFIIFKEKSENFVRDLKKENDKAIDLIPIVSQLTLNTICETAMGVKLEDVDKGNTYRNNVYEIGKKLVVRLLRPWLFSDFMFALLGYEKEFNINLKPLHNFTDKVIKQRKESINIKQKSAEQKQSFSEENLYFKTEKRRYAMLDTLLQAQLEGLIDDRGIREEVDTFTFEGHDTTSSGLIFTLLLLAHNPQSQQKISDEIEIVLKSRSTDNILIDDLGKMSYLDRVIKECLRIYPPVTFISREFSEDLEHDGVKYKKGNAAHIFIYDIHRDEEQFPNPEQFDPDRFLLENCEKRHKFSYIPFSAGPRNCIGQKFALLELKTIVTAILQKFELFPITKREEVIFLGDLVLRSKNSIKIKFVIKNKRMESADI